LSYFTLKGTCRPYNSVRTAEGEEDDEVSKDVILLISKEKHFARIVNAALLGALLRLGMHQFQFLELLELVRIGIRIGIGWNWSALELVHP
jgi:hypothetical protein